MLVSAAIGPVMFAVTGSPVSLLLSVLAPAGMLASALDQRALGRERPRRGQQRPRDSHGDGAPPSLPPRERRADAGWGTEWDGVCRAIPVGMEKREPIEVHRRAPRAANHGRVLLGSSSRSRATARGQRSVLLPLPSVVAIRAPRAVADGVARAVIAGAFRLVHPSLLAVEDAGGCTRGVRSYRGRRAASADGVVVSVVEARALGAGPPTPAHDGAERARSLRIVICAVGEPIPPGTTHVLELSRGGEWRTRVEETVPDGIPAALGRDRTPASSLPDRSCRIDLVSAGELAVMARELGERAARWGASEDDADQSPSEIAGSMLDGSPTGGTPGEHSAYDGTTLVGSVGRADGAAVEVDLVRDGPHALVVGTTGSGKSVLITTWLLGMAVRHSPDRLTFAVVDFKGGTGLGDLAGLPHCRGFVSDLSATDLSRVARALSSELAERERRCALAGVRDVTELASGERPARLIVVVDEFVAAVEASPVFERVLGDLAARGRSLGIHVIVSTQNLGGAVRSRIQNNCALRMCLTVLDGAESLAVVGVRGAERLDTVGSFLCARGGSTQRVRGGAPTMAQRSEAMARAAHVGARAASDPLWLDPLPARVTHADLARLAESGGGSHDVERQRGPAGVRSVPGPARSVLGMSEEHDARRRSLATFDPQRDGTLLVVGVAGSGRTAVLRQLDDGRPGTVFLDAARTPEEAWDVLAWADHAIAEQEALPRRLLMDDVDTLLSRLGASEQQLFIERLIRVAAAAPARGTVVAVSSRRSGGPLVGLDAVSTRLRLGVTVVEPGRAGSHDADGSGEGDLPRGRGVWRGRPVQCTDPGAPPARRHCFTPSGRHAAAALDGCEGTVQVVLKDPDRWPDPELVAEMRARGWAVIGVEDALRGRRAHADVLLCDSELRSEFPLLNGGTVRPPYTVNRCLWVVPRGGPVRRIVVSAVERDRLRRPHRADDDPAAEDIEPELAADGVDVARGDRAGTGQEGQPGDRRAAQAAVQHLQRDRRAVRRAHHHHALRAELRENAQPVDDDGVRPPDPVDGPAVAHHGVDQDPRVAVEGER